MWDRLRSKGARRARDQQGFTLIELTVAATMGLVLLAAVLQILVIAGHKAAAVDSRRDDTEEARTVLDRLVRELRQSSDVRWVSSTSITYDMTVPSGTATVTVSCSASSCLRTSAGSTLAFVGVTNTDVFCLAGHNCNDCGGQVLTTPAYVVVRLTVTGARGSVSLCDGANPRTQTLGS